MRKLAVRKRRVPKMRRFRRRSSTLRKVRHSRGRSRRLSRRLPFRSLSRRSSYGRRRLYKRKYSYHRRPLRSMRSKSLRTYSNPMRRRTITGRGIYRLGRKISYLRKPYSYQYRPAIKGHGTYCLQGFKNRGFNPVITGSGRYKLQGRRRSYAPVRRRSHRRGLRRFRRIARKKHVSRLRNRRVRRRISIRKSVPRRKISKVTTKPVVAPKTGPSFFSRVLNKIPGPLKVIGAAGALMGTALVAAKFGKTFGLADITKWDYAGAGRAASNVLQSAKENAADLVIRGGLGIKRASQAASGFFSRLLGHIGSVPGKIAKFYNRYVRHPVSNYFKKRFLPGLESDSETLTEEEVPEARGRSSRRHSPSPTGIVIRTATRSPSLFKGRKYSPATKALFEEENFVGEQMAGLRSGYKRKSRSSSRAGVRVLQHGYYPDVGFLGYD